MGKGLETEISDVAVRIAREAGAIRDVNDHDAGEVSSFRTLVRKLRPLAIRLHRLYELQCEREMRPSEARIERQTEARCLYLAHIAGVRVTFNGDPRGAPVVVPSSRYSNDFGGTAIVIPYLPAREYDR